MFSLKLYYVNYHFLTTLLILITGLTSVAQINDDFSDNDFTTGTTWSGDASLFSASTGVLQSQSPGANLYYLSTPSTISSDAEWVYYSDFQLSTSGSNFVDVYLMSDQADLDLATNGYFVRMGGTADEISLYKKVAGSETVIIDGTDGLINSSSSNPFTIKVTRDVSNNWTLQYDDLGSSPSGGFVTEGTVNDNSVTSSSFFGFLITQSSAASAVNSHFFDNISVDNIAPDLQAPSVTDVSVVSSSTLEITFDEAVDITTAQNSTNYSGTSPGAITTATLTANPAVVSLTFDTPFNQGITYSLTVNGVEDLSSNAMTSSMHDYLYFVPVPAQVGDVIINEVFCDPSPQIGLPSGEYVEIYNRSTNIYDLNGWTIGDASSSSTLPSHLLLPGEVVAIADDGFITEFSIFPNIIYVSSLPSLNNTGDDVVLTDDNSLLIDKITYNDSWYQDGSKDGGGYSLELINPLLPCASSSNWIASNDANGGTPGEENSVYDITPDLTAPSLVGQTVLSNFEIEFCFDESVDTAALNISMFSFNGGISPIFYSLSADLTCITLNCTPALDTGFVYSVTISGVSDCSGNSASNIQTEIVLPSLPQAGDLIINEVMFNPFTGGSDFIEVYNNSSRYIDLFGFFLANYDDGIIDNYKEVTEHKLLNPGDFVVLTKDSADIKLNYLGAATGSFVEMSSLPSYNDDSATVYLAMPDSNLSDNFSYDNDMQYPLLKDEDGVSLERIDYNRASSDITNWHSGAENVGWATPGYENSQYFPGVLTDDMVSTSPEIFSPDNDGFEDVLNISYTLDAPGYVGSITIFDRFGRTVRQLVQNDLLTAEGTITWDGTNNNREKAQIGVYIIYFEVFDLDGNVSSVKKSTVLGGRL